VSVAWGAALGETFASLLPYVLCYWHIHAPMPWWVVAQTAGGVLIAAGSAVIVGSLVEFITARGTSLPQAPPHLVVRGSYRYV